jgi:excisionase family DNA binding protein
VNETVTENNERLLTAREVRDRLRLPLSTVYYLAKEGKLRGFRVGRSWRFHVSEINRIMQVDRYRHQAVPRRDEETTQ